MSAQVWINGVPAATFTRYGLGGLSWSHVADGGCKEASWQMDLPPRFTHPSLVGGASVEIRYGPKPVWAGLLTDPDPSNDGSFTAVGYSTLAVNGYLAMDSSFNPSFVPDAAIDRAIGAGIGWTRPASLSSTAYKPATGAEPQMYLGALLDAWATSNGLRWGVDALRQVYATADPGIPTWYLVPQSGRFGIAGDEYASDLFLQYATGATTRSVTTVADSFARQSFYRREVAVDLTSLGTITGTAARTVGNGMLAKGKSRQSYTNNLEVSQYQLVTPGGRQAPLQLVRGQQLVRQFGVLNQQGQPVPFLDWVIGETKYEAGASTLALAPVDRAARDLSTVLTAIKGAK